jgi:ABC-type sugar transport system substrate-binding protein
MKRLFSVFLALTVALVLGGSAFAAAPALDASGNQIEVAFVPPALESPFYQQCIDAAKPYADQWGWKLTVLAPDNTEDYNGQVKICEDLIQRGVDGLIICSLDVNAIVSGIITANKAGVPVVLFNTTTDSPGGEIYAYSGYDQRVAGATMADWIAKQTGGKCTVGIIEGLLGLHSNERKGGFLDRVNEAYPNFKISASQSAGWSRQNAMDIAINMYQADPTINVFFACNDDMALGAVQGMKQLGIEGIITVGLDANENALQSVKNGGLTGSCYVGAPEQGENAILAMKDALDGKPSASLADSNKKIFAPVFVIDATTVDKYL